MTKIAILKPDHGVSGGFERVVEKVQRILEDDGYDVTRLTVDLGDVAQVAHARRVERELWESSREFLTYLHGRDRFDGLNTSAYDLVISTAPPSYVHRHRRHLALFYHHQRVFYDLEDLYVMAGFPPDPEAHRRAAELVRSLDRGRIAQVRNLMCPSETVQRRLERFNGRDTTFPFHAGIGIDDQSTGASRSGPAASELDVTARMGALCVGRHEFPKRTELFVAAAHLVDPSIAMTCTGVGGRFAWAHHLDRGMGTGMFDASTIDAETLWCNTGAAPTAADDAPTRTTFTGRVDDARLDHLYRTTRCVVAPAYDEDYGLTAIEAMAHGRPVIVCDDGGGLAELVDHDRTGLVVAPTPTAIAAAVTRLHDDPDLAERLGRQGRERAAELTWAAAAKQLRTAVTATLDGVGS